MPKVGHNDPILTVSVAAQLAGMHPQTVRQYDRLGLVKAQRTQGGGRRYSMADVERLQEVQQLSQEEGINLAGVQQIMQMRAQIEKLNARIAKLEKTVAHQAETIMESQQAAQAQRSEQERVFAVGPEDDVVMLANRAALMRARMHGMRAVDDPGVADPEHADGKQNEADQNGQVVIWRPVHPLEWIFGF
ncbi:MAG: helix-turn-helix transcriptional regulator [Actinomycetaceae bacterium]|nr:helix-turn-helix transcriptional regulator [Actinomycetaceae bacterium]MDY6082603.1 helix-turn-helix transcriptional regulator [Actinomycetaceae bacterium]